MRFDVAAAPWSARAEQLRDEEGAYADYMAFREWADKQLGGYSLDDPNNSSSVDMLAYVLCWNVVTYFREDQE